MSDRPTFSLTDDWVVLADLDHLTFRIYCILRTNAEFGRGGIVNHTVHVTASWVVDSTSHWEKPLAMSTVRKHMQKLVEAGVLIRVNSPGEGVGVIYQFVSDPGEEYAHPVNGFEHAKRISRGRGTTSTYRRIPLNDENFTRSTKSRKVAIAPDFADDLDSAMGQYVAKEEPEFDLSGLDSVSVTPHADPPGSDLTISQQEFATELEALTSNNRDEHLRLMAGQCARIAEAVHPALERGWEPGALAKRLAAELNPKIHSPESLLKKKAADLGAPPVKPEQAGEDMLFIKGRLVDVSDYDPGFGYGSAPKPDVLEIPGLEPVAQPEVPLRETKEERLANLARKYAR